jgi:hypothetical protein
MGTFDPDNQVSYNGPLSAKLIKKIQRLRVTDRSLTLATLGVEMNISGPFLSTLLRDPNPASVRTRHVERIAAAVAKLEAQEGLGSQTESESGPESPPRGSLEDLIQLAHAKGFAVTFTPLPAE